MSDYRRIRSVPSVHCEPKSIATRRAFAALLAERRVLWRILVVAHSGSTFSMLPGMQGTTAAQNIATFSVMPLSRQGGQTSNKTLDPTPSHV